jgi:hypothetical protein
MYLAISKDNAFSYDEELEQKNASESQRSWPGLPNTNIIEIKMNYRMCFIVIFSKEKLINQLEHMFPNNYNIIHNIYWAITNMKTLCYLFSYII